MGRLSPLARIIVSVMIGLAFSGGMVLADDDHEQAKELRDAGDILPLAEIIARAQQVRPGRLLETELETKGGRYLYELEILDEAGVVWELTFDAQTGEWLGGKEEDE